MSYVDGLRAARAVVAKQERALEASPVLGFNKVKFFLGVTKSYFTVFILGHAPHRFPAWHALQFALLLPMQIYRWGRMKGLAYFLEFCWCANALISFYIAALYLSPDSVDPEIRARGARLLFAFGCGPLGMSVVLLGNALVPHSIDHMMSLLIHLQPAITAFCVRWRAVDASLFPIEAVGFVDYAAPPLAFLGAWAVCHALFFAAVGVGLPDRGFETTYHYNLASHGGDNAFAAVLGKFGDGSSELARFLKYEILSVLSNAGVIALTFVPFTYGTEALHFAILLATACASAWNGAGWYQHKITKSSKEIDRLIAAGAAPAAKSKKDS